MTADTEGVNTTVREGRDSLEDMYCSTHLNRRINRKSCSVVIAIYNSDLPTRGVESRMERAQAGLTSFNYASRMDI